MTLQCFLGIFVYYWIFLFTIGYYCLLLDIWVFLFTTGYVYYWIACYIPRKISAVETPGKFIFWLYWKKYFFVWWGTVIGTTFHSINRSVSRSALSKTHLIQGLSLQYLIKHSRLTIVFLITKLELQIETT